ncbi:MAG: carboxypeptidase regulatory-like domain-containing protein, partial [Pyrinomonadaceae bacterium]
MRFTKFLIQFVFVVAICAMGTFSQVTGGAVTGNVVDPNGATVRGATVVLKDKARGQEFTAQTTDAGSYQFPNVQTGEYTLTVSATGFTAANREVIVSLNQTTTVDVALTVGGSSAVVDVIAGGEGVVQTDTSQIGTTFKGRAAQDLPINGDANNLALLAPNVIPPANGTLGSGGSSGGIRARGNSFNIDGVDNNDAGVTGPAITPIQDAVEEFTLLQNNFSAEFGAGAGGQFNQITKSGTNDYHGNLFSYIGSQKLNARSTNEDGGDKNYFKEVRYGFTFGGPLPTPHFGEGGPRFNSGKNKLFFFTAYEKYFQEGASVPGEYSAPTEAGLNQIAASPLASQYLINLMRTYVTLPTTTSFTQTVLGIPNVPFGDVFLPIPASQEQKAFQLNIDHLPNERNQFRYRYSRARYAAEQAGNGGLAFNNFLAFNSDIFSVNWVGSISPTVVNDLRLSYFRTITDYPLVNPGVADFPNLTILDVNLVIGPNGNLPQSGYDNNYQLYDSITWVTGAHTLKFGGDVRRYLGGSDFLPRARGDYEWSTFEFFIQDLRPDSRNIRGVGSGRFVANNHRFFGFAQDDWKVRPNLTLNLGVRYEYQGLYRDAALQATAAPAN